jgi:D-glycero-D-manno-heptose 1,7-bisphosphate phosphatase
MARELLRDLAHSAANFVPQDAALQLCPHPLESACGCRKPAPGMLLAIMEFYGIEPADTLFVGNHEVDREAAVRAQTAFRWAGDFFGQLQ